MARFADLRQPNRPGIDLADGAREEVSLELGISPRTAATQVRRAKELVTRLPETLEALAAGRIDHARAVAMTELTSVLSVEDARLVEIRVLSRGRRASVGRFKEAIRSHASKVDAHADEKRAAAAQSCRDVHYQPCFDGMAVLTAELTQSEAAAAQRRVDDLAEVAHTPGHPRSPDEVRADVLVDLILGGQDNINVTVNATVSAETLAILNEDPSKLVGYQAVMARRAAELVSDNTWRHMIEDPVGNTLHASERRKPSASLTRFLHVRDRNCRVPGCTAPADTTEIDHTVRHADRGMTSPDNTGSFCKFHNLWKERSSWQVNQPRPGTFTFTSPEGRVYTSHPEPYEEPQPPPFEHTET
ncbi:HNH endonuclease signature motif containing protein [Actinocrispum wychmicini]|nr:HNH endonuclease signature motif containing protein [Actinocrispum wychmicini]